MTRDHVLHKIEFGFSFNRSSGLSAAGVSLEV